MQRPTAVFIAMFRRTKCPVHTANLAVMRALAQRAGVELSESAGQDQFRVDPRLLSEKQLWVEQIHDSRKYSSTYITPEVLRRSWRAVAGYGDPFESMDRRKRDIYFTDGSHETFDSEQLEKLWRSQNGYDLVVTEDDNAPGAKRE